MTSDYYIIFLQQGSVKESMTPPQREDGKLFSPKDQILESLIKNLMSNTEELSNEKMTVHVCICGNEEFEKEVEKNFDEEIKNRNRHAEIVKEHIDSPDMIYDLPCYKTRPAGERGQPKRDGQDGQKKGEEEKKNANLTEAGRIRSALPENTDLSDAEIYQIIIAIRQVQSSSISPNTPINNYEYFKAIIRAHTVGDGKAEKIIKEVEKGDTITKILKIMEKT